MPKRTPSSTANRRLKTRKGRSSFYYQRAVPRDLQPELGKVIEDCLHTSDLREARRLRDIRDVRWDAEFDKLRTIRNQAGPVAQSNAILQELRTMLADLLKTDQTPDSRLAEVAPWEDRAEAVVARGDSVPLDIQRQAVQLSRTINAFYHDPLEFNREAAEQLLQPAKPVLTLSQLRDQYLQHKEEQGRRKKGRDNQRMHLNTLESAGWDARRVLKSLQDAKRAESTINNWMITYSAFKNWLAKEHKVELEVPAYKRTKFSGTRDIFTVEELRALYQYDMNETMKWVCLVSLHQGFRMAETLQLSYADIRQHHDVLIFDINDRGGKTLKTGSTARKVPVHPWLLEHGLMAYWDKHKGWARVWQSYDGTPSQGFSKAVNRTIRKALQMQTSDTETGKKVFHSFRHTFRDHAREAGLQEYIIDAIGGWSLKKYGEGAGYGRGHGMAAMLEQLRKVSFGL